jgi:hypothetical protein
MSECTFVNENGNEIHVSVSSTDELGDVRIFITGPHSDQESILTRMEAGKLYTLLADHLGGQGRFHDHWCDLRHDGLECNCSHDD